MSNIHSDYFNDEEDVVATESYAVISQAMGTVSSPIDTGISVFSEPDGYVVVIDLSKLSIGNKVMSNAVMGLSIWLDQLSEVDSVSLNILGKVANMGDIGVFDLFSRYGLLSALINTRATVTGQIDKMQYAYNSMILLTCDRFEVSSYGALIISTLTGISVGDKYMVFKDYVEKVIYKKALLTGILTEDEYNGLCNGEHICINSDTLATRV